MREAFKDLEDGDEHLWDSFGIALGIIVSFLAFSMVLMRGWVLAVYRKVSACRYTRVALARRPPQSYQGDV